MGRVEEPNTFEKVDPSKVAFWGWERKKDPRKVWVMAEHLRNGGQFRPVRASWREDGGLDLNKLYIEGRGFPPIFDGGHHRVLAHIIAEHEMPVEITPRPRTLIQERRRYLVADSELRFNRSEWNYYRKPYDIPKGLEVPVEQMVDCLAVLSAAFRMQVTTTEVPVVE